MARRIRYIIPNIPHHTLQRGNNRQVVFADEEDRKIFLSTLKKFSTENNVAIGAYCLMTNHFHLLLYPDTHEGLINLMKYISQLHTQHINRKYGRTGKLWENRYKLNIVDPEYEWVIARYIELNPVRANMVDRVEDYKYSSARIHLLGEKDEVVGKNIIGDRSEEYLEFINEKNRSNPKQLSQMRSVIKQEKVFGSEAFIQCIEERFKTFFRIRGRGRPAKIKTRCE